MAFNRAVNCRATNAGSYANLEGANEIYNLLEQYPISRGGYNSGWVTTSSGIDSRDRDFNLDRRLAGINFMSAGSVLDRDFRLNIPATGAAVIHLASGDTVGGTGGIITVWDGDAGSGTLLFTLDQGAYGVGAGHCMDAAGAIYTDAAWPGSETGVAVAITQDHVVCRLNNAYQPSGSQPFLRHFRAVSAALTDLGTGTAAATAAASAALTTAIKLAANAAAQASAQGSIGSVSRLVVTLANRSDVPWANLTNLTGSIFTETGASSLATKLGSFTGGTTDGNGVMTIPVVGGSVGQSVGVVVDHPSGKKVFNVGILQ